jgi:TM2 domain-containing membrane protein YozV
MSGLGKEGMHSKGIAYLLWLGWPLGLAGLHRFYLGRPVSGFFYLITWGFLGIGQIIDLFRMPRIVREENLKLLKEEAAVYGSLGIGPAGLLPESAAAQGVANVRQLLLQAAAKNDGKLSITQGVMATGRDFAEVQAILDEMVKSGYVGMDNDPASGHMVYYFPQLSR